MKKLSYKELVNLAAKEAGVYDFSPYVVENLDVGDDWTENVSDCADYDRELECLLIGLHEDAAENAYEDADCLDISFKVQFLRGHVVGVIAALLPYGKKIGTWRSRQ
jgi:hypothetical protein